MKKGVGIILFFVTLYLVYFFVVRHQRQIHYKRAKETCSKYFSNVDKKYTNQEELFPPKNEYNCSEILNEHKSNLKFCSTEKTAMLKGLFYVFSINQILSHSLALTFVINKKNIIEKIFVIKKNFTSRTIKKFVFNYF